MYFSAEIQGNVFLNSTGNIEEPEPLFYGNLTLRITMNTVSPKKLLPLVMLIIAGFLIWIFTTTLSYPFVPSPVWQKMCWLLIYPIVSLIVLTFILKKTRMQAIKANQYIEKKHLNPLLKGNVIGACVQTALIILLFLGLLVDMILLAPGSLIHYFEPVKGTDIAISVQSVNCNSGRRTGSYTDIGFTQLSNNTPGDISFPDNFCSIFVNFDPQSLVGKPNVYLQQQDTFFGTLFNEIGYFDYSTNTQMVVYTLSNS